MDKIKRYDCSLGLHYDHPQVDWDECEDGQYIKSEDFDEYDKKQADLIKELEDDLDMCQRYLFENGCDNFLAWKRHKKQELMDDAYQEGG